VSGNDGTPPTGSSDWKPIPSGSVLRGRYVVESKIGQGGFGATYSASDNGRFGEPCLVKELVPQSGSVAKAVQRFEREAMTLVDLVHPGIPTLQEFFEEDGRCFLVQDLVEGQTLADIVHQDGPLNEAQVRDVLGQLLVILDYLHSRYPPVVHRDVTPSNIIRGPNGRIHLIDFGAVREAVEAPEGTPHSAVWTPGYAPVDQFMGRVSPWCDLFGAGATAMYLLTGRPPTELFDPSAESFKFDFQISHSLQQFITRLTVKDENTIGSAADAVQLLEKTEPHEPVTQLSAGPSAQSPPPHSTAAPAQNPRARAKRRMVVGAAAAAVVATAAVVAIVMSEPSDGSGDGVAVSGPPEGLPASAAPTAPLALDAIARTTTESGLVAEVIYPSSWRVTTTSADSHLAIRDPNSGAVFLAGVDVLSGTGTRPSDFVEQWRTGGVMRYGTVSRVVEGVPSGDAWPFRLEWVLADGLQTAGSMLVTPFTQPDGGTSLFRWWATVGNQPEAVPTLLAIAQSLEITDSGPDPP